MVNSILDKLQTLPGYTNDEIAKIQERIGNEFQKQREDPQNFEQYLEPYQEDEKYDVVEMRSVPEEQPYNHTETYKEQESYVDTETVQQKESYEVDEDYTEKEPYTETVSEEKQEPYQTTETYQDKEAYNKTI